MNLGDKASFQLEKALNENPPDLNIALESIFIFEYITNSEPKKFIENFLYKNLVNFE